MRGIALGNSQIAVFIKLNDNRSDFQQGVFFGLKPDVSMSMMTGR